MFRNATLGGYRGAYAALTARCCGGKCRRAGIDMQTLLLRFIECGLVLDDLYQAVCDDRYD